jgi:hypothetical protein
MYSCESENPDVCSIRVLGYDRQYTIAQAPKQGLILQVTPLYDIWLYSTQMYYFSAWKLQGGVAVVKVSSNYFRRIWNFHYILYWLVLSKAVETFNFVLGRKIFLLDLSLHLLARISRKKSH